MEFVSVLELVSVLEDDEGVQEEEELRCAVGRAAGGGVVVVVWVCAALWVRSRTIWLPASADMSG